MNMLYLKRCFYFLLILQSYTYTSAFCDPGNTKLVNPKAKPTNNLQSPKIKFCHQQIPRDAVEVYCSHTVTNWKSLSSFHKLRTLSLIGPAVNSLHDFSMLPKTLAGLTLQDGRLNSSFTLNHLRGLRVLTIKNIDHVSVVKDLSNLPMLAYLTISHSYLTKVPKIYFTLQYLDLSYTSVQDFTALNMKFSALQALTLRGSTIKSLQPLASITALEDLRVIDLSDTMLRDLTPLKQFRYLKSITPPTIQICGQKVSMLTDRLVCETRLNANDRLEISQLKHLRVLDLQHAQSADLTVLKKLTHLKELYLSGDHYVSLRNIDHSSSLEFLHLTNFTALDLTGIENLKKLSTLVLSQMIPTIDASPLSQVHTLKHLLLDSVQITNTNALRTLTSLQSFSAHNVSFDDLDFLKFFTLQKLSLIASTFSGFDLNLVKSMATSLKQLTILPISTHEISPLGTLTHLQELTLGDLDVAQMDITPIAKLTHLQELKLINLNIATLGPLQSLDHLVELSLEGTQVKDWSGLAFLTHMKRLDLSHTQFGQGAELSALGHLSTLNDLNISHTPVNTLTPLFALKNLHKLNMSHTKITQLKGLSQCKRLKIFYFRNTAIFDLNELLAMPQIHALDYSPLDTMRFIHENDKLALRPILDLPKIIAYTSAQKTGVRSSLVSSISLELGSKEIKEFLAPKVKFLARTLKSLLESYHIDTLQGPHKMEYIRSRMKRVIKYVIRSELESSVSDRQKRDHIMHRSVINVWPARWDIR